MSAAVRTHRDRFGHSRHAHGGIACESTHSPRFAVRASASKSRKLWLVSLQPSASHAAPPIVIGPLPRKAESHSSCNDYDARTQTVVQSREDVAIADADHAAGEVCSEGVTGYQRDAKEQRCGNDWP